MEEKVISEKESLLLIQQMIHTAKKEQKDDGMGWIVFGWMLFLSSILSVLNVELKWNLNLFFFWNLFGGFTVLYFIYETVRYFFFRNREKVKTYTGDLFARLNTGFFISLMFIIVSINVAAYAIHDRFGVSFISPVNIGFALLVNLYSFWILIYGTALNFKPSIIGAYISWAIGLTALFVNTFQQVMMLHALAVLVGYIIPGHIANSEFKKIKRKEKEAESV